MLSFAQLFESRPWRWRLVASAQSSKNHNLTLRELLESLEAHRNRTTVRSPYLQRLISLVKDDVASSECFPLRRGGPDTPRTLGAWRSRYNHLDSYLGVGGACSARPDAGSAEALSAAEYEGWPLPRA